MKEDSGCNGTIRFKLYILRELGKEVAGGIQRLSWKKLKN